MHCGECHDKKKKVIFVGLKNRCIAISASKLGSEGHHSFYVHLPFVKIALSEMFSVLRLVQVLRERLVAMQKLVIFILTLQKQTNAAHQQTNQLTIILNSLAQSSLVSIIASTPPPELK